MDKLDTHQLETALMANPAISRRVFLSSAAVVGSLTFMGSAFDGRIVAFADEAGNYSFVITVIGRENLTILAIEAETGKAAEGMRVTLSAENGQEYSFVTDETGLHTFNARALSNQAGNDFAQHYSFTCDIAAEQVRDTAPSTYYHPYYDQNHFVLCGCAFKDESLAPNLVIPCSIDDGTPSLERATFNGVDVLRSESSFIAGPQNTGEHEMVLGLKATENSAYSAKLYVNDATTPIATASGSTDAKGFLTLTMRGKWLTSLKHGDKFKVILAGARGDAITFTPLLGFDEYNAPKGVGICNDNMSPSSVDPETSVTSSLPDMFFVKDTPFTVSLPGFPVKAYRDPLGNSAISVTLGGFSKDFNEQASKWNDGKWTHLASKSFDDIMDSYWTDLKKISDNMTNAGYLSGDVDKTVGAAPAIEKTSFSITFSICAMTHAEADWVNYRDVLTTSAYFVADFRFSYSTTKCFWVSVVPVYIAGDFTASATLKVGVTFTDYIKKESGETTCTLAPVDGVKFNVVFAVRIEIGVGAGVGIPGILSIGLRGYGAIESDTVFKKEGDKPFPHQQVYAEAGLSLCAQALFYSESWTLCSTGKQYIYDNWSDSASSLESTQEEGFKFLNDAFGNATQATTNANELEMVSEARLSSAAEFTASVNDCGALCNVQHIEKTQQPSRKPISIDIRDPHGSDPYDPAKGLKPEYQELVAKDVFSDPRGDILIIGDTAYMFRIAIVDVELSEDNDNLDLVTDGTSTFFQATQEGATRLASLLNDGSSYSAPCKFVNVTSNGEEALDGSLSDWLAQTNDGQSLQAATATTVPRGRLVWSSCPNFSPASGLIWDDPQVVDFDIPAVNMAALRANISDVDFSVCPGPNNTVNVALTSIMRPCDEETDFSTQFQKQFVTFLRLDLETNQASDVKTTLNSTDHEHWSWNPTVKFAQNGSRSYAMVSFQQVTTWKDPIMGKRTYHSFDIMYVDEDGIVSIADVSGNAPYGLNPTTDGILDMQIAWNSWFNNPNALMAWSYSGNDESGEGTRSALWCVGGEWGEGEVSKIFRNAPRAIPASVCTGVPGFIIIEEQPGIEKKSVYAVGLYASGMHSDKPGTTELVNVLTSSKGHGLYALRIMEGNVSGLGEAALSVVRSGDARVFGSDHPFSSELSSYDTKSKCEGGSIRHYQLLYSPYSQSLGKYMGFYPLALLDCPPDSVLGIEEDDDAVTVLYSTITDLDNCKADVYRAVIGKVRCMQLKGFGSTDAYVGIGDACHVQVSVHNAGSVPLSGFTLELYTSSNGEKTLFETIQVDDLDQRVVPDVNCLEQVLDKNGNPTGEYEKKLQPYDEAGLLWPGTTRTYLATFTVPREWDLQNVEITGTVKDPVEGHASLTQGSFASSSGSVIEVIPPASFMSTALSTAELDSLEAEYRPNLPAAACVYAAAPATKPSTPAKKITLRVPTGFKISKKKRDRITLKWKNRRAVADGATGYELRYRKKGKKTWKTKRINNPKAIGATIKKLKHKTTYEFQLRSIYKKGKTKIVSKWTSIKRGKTKK